MTSELLRHTAGHRRLPPCFFRQSSSLPSSLRLCWSKPALTSRCLTRCVHCGCATRVWWLAPSARCHHMRTHPHARCRPPRAQLLRGIVFWTSPTVDEIASILPRRFKRSKQRTIEAVSVAHVNRPPDMVLGLTAIRAPWHAGWRGTHVYGWLIVLCACVMVCRACGHSKTCAWRRCRWKSTNCSTATAHVSRTGSSSSPSSTNRCELRWRCGLGTRHVGVHLT